MIGLDVDGPGILEIARIGGIRGCRGPLTVAVPARRGADLRARVRQPRELTTDRYELADHHQIVEQIRTALHSGDPGTTAGSPGWRRPMPRPATRPRSGWADATGCCSRGCDPRRSSSPSPSRSCSTRSPSSTSPSGPSGTTLVQMRDLTPAPSSRSSRPGCSTRRMRRRTRSRTCSDAIAGWPCNGPRSGLRIAVLRQLAAQDPGNPIWADDLRGVRGGPAAGDPGRGGRGAPPPRRRGDRPAGRGGRAAGMDRAAAEGAGPVAAEGRRADPRRASTGGPGGRRGPARRGAQRSATRSAAAWPARSGRGWPTAAALPHDDPIAERARPALDWLDEQDRRDRESRQHEEALVALVRALDYPGSVRPPTSSGWPTRSQPWPRPARRTPAALYHPAPRRRGGAVAAGPADRRRVGRRRSSCSAP